MRFSSGALFAAFAPQATRQNMKSMKTVVLVLAVLATLVGLIWIGQGTGYFPYPRSSFMIDERPWAYRGAALAAVGIAAIVLLRRHRSRVLL